MRRKVLELVKASVISEKKTGNSNRPDHEPRRKIIAEENNKLENLMTLSLNEIPKFPDQYNNKKQKGSLNQTLQLTVQR
jgi:hypothetical protein